MLNVWTKAGFLRHVATSCRRLINCNACGVKLQDKDPRTVGFYLKPKIREVNKNQSLEDVKYLLFSQDIQMAKQTVPTASFEELKKAETNPLICKRCNDALHLNKYEEEDFRRFSFDEVLKFVPANSNMIHVVPLPEFPFHLTKEALKTANIDSTLLLTKGDQLVKDKSTLQKKVSIFFRDFLKYHMGLLASKIVATSAKRNWNIRSFYSNMKASNYLIGNANVGKSTLINSLLKEYMGYKISTDRLGNIKTLGPSEEDLKDEERFLKAQSAGVSHIPNMTRNVQAYKVSDKVIYDLPGFVKNVDEPKLDDIIHREWLDKIRKTDQFRNRKLKRKTYISLKGTENGRCLTLGGIFFLVPPPGSINQVINYIPGREHQFKDVTKALEVFESCNELNEEHPLSKYCGIKSAVCKPEKFARHVIPPFQGSIEIVLKDIGYLLLRATGKYRFEAPYEIWAPEGIEICVREPLESLIEEGFLRSIESQRKRPACPHTRPVISSTYIMDHTETKPLERMQEMYLERTKNDLSSRRYATLDPWEVVKEVSDEPPNLYWYFQW